MSIEEIEKEVLSLPEDQRAGLASRILASLPPVLADEDCGLTEALKRDAEMDRDPSTSMTIDEFKAAFGK